MAIASLLRSSSKAVSPQSLRQAWLALAGLAAVFLFEMVDNSILTVALPTIGRSLHASTLELGWINGVYPVVFAGLMLLFGSLADRFGRKRLMLIGLTLLAVVSASTALVTTPYELILVRGLMGVAAAMTTPLSLALTFRLFENDSLRLRAMSLVSTVGLIGLAVGPTVGGLLLTIAPWQGLLVFNAPLAVLAIFGIARGVGADSKEELLRSRLDVGGAVLGAAAIGATLLAPTLFVAEKASVSFWAVTASAVALWGAFVLRERAASTPLLPFELVTLPLVSSGLLYKAAVGFATAGLSYAVTLQLQLGYGWSPALAAVGMLPQVVTLLIVGPFTERFVKRYGFSVAAWASSALTVAGLVLYAVMNAHGYLWLALALVLVAAGMRINGLVAGTNVFRGLPKERTGLGASLVDTAAQLAAGIGVTAVTIGLAAVGHLNTASVSWTARETASFSLATTVMIAVLAALSATCAVWAYARSRSVHSSSV